MSIPIHNQIIYKVQVMMSNAEDILNFVKEIPTNSKREIIRNDLDEIKLKCAEIDNLLDKWE